MNGIGNVAGTALQAFSTSQQVSANNLANINTDEFKASRTTFQENGSGGVSATASATKDTVEISKEAMDLMSSATGFKANVAVMKTSDDMMKDLFSIMA